MIRCAICQSPRRQRLEEMILGGMSAAAAARALNLPGQTARRHMSLHLERRDAEPVASAVIPTDPIETFREAFGHEAMDHQAEYLRETRNLAAVKPRQAGFTEAAAALLIHIARLVPGSLSAILSPSLRQSSYAGSRARTGLLNLGETLRQDSASAIRLKNGSLILSLPGTDTAVRGYAIGGVLCLDESAWIPDRTFAAARATVAAAGGRIVAQSTPGEPTGFFYDLVTDTPEAWARMVVTADQVPTLSEEFLARERAEMSASDFAAEYMATFPDAAASLPPSIFSPEKLKALVVPGTKPLFETWPGQKADES